VQLLLSSLLYAQDLSQTKGRVWLVLPEAWWIIRPAFHLDMAAPTCLSCQSQAAPDNLIQHPCLPTPSPTLSDCPVGHAVSSPTGPKHEVNLIGQQVKPGASYISATSILSRPSMRPTPPRARAAPRALALQNVAASLHLNMYQQSPFSLSSRLDGPSRPCYLITVMSATSSISAARSSHYDMAFFGNLVEGTKISRSVSSSIRIGSYFST
jgi:hypothetical protein